MEVSWRGESAKVCREYAKQERIKRVYPPLMQNEDGFESFFLFKHVSTGNGIEKQKIMKRFTKEIKFEI